MNVKNVLLILSGAAMVTAFSFMACKSSDKSSQQPVNKDSVAVTVDSSSVPTVLTDSTRVILKYRVHPGDVYNFHETVHSLSHGTFNKSPSQSTEESSYNFSIRIVRTLPDSSIQIMMTYDSINVKVQTDNKMRQFRSGDANQMHDPAYLIYATLIQAPILVTIGNGGDITRVDSLDAIVEKILAGDPHKDSLPPEVRVQLANQISDGAVKAIVQHVFSHFGTEPVAKNGTWASHFQSTADVFPTDNVITYTLSDLSTAGPMRSATFTSDLKVKVLKTKINDSTAAVSFKGGSFSGTASTQVDLVHGITMHKTARMEITINITAVGHGAYASNVGDIKKTTIRETMLERL